ncbi:G-protein coupled receptor 157 isoform X2 [Latimeria chalumnae]|uniref:G-protein coupled receptor 157 isoform X2 n=1 Tax=Latimeria chalumnae TaxID=7897 RepID=UPI0003C1910E|nr:PREDICTED: probable G-protein coupled receptor 157 isoform X2 [Latimeria chalumnae]|eukprot:XP_005986037.1 PREDICTED: probable G-protein coupled receptor 157 isoform X2 [Latimeria chalumnae]
MSVPAVETQVYFYEQVVILVSCALSLLGSGLIIIIHIAWPDLRTKPRQLLLYLSLVDFVSAGSYCYGVLKVFKSSSWDCVLQGALSTFSNTSSFFWTVAIAVYLYIVIVKSDERFADSLILWFHLISWSVPLVITIAAVALNKIGYDASDVSVGWCWVSIQAEDHLFWMLLTGKIWEIMAYITLPIIYILIRRHIHTAHAALSEYRPLLANNLRSQPSSSVADKKLTLIPLIFIFLRIWSTVRFILTISNSPAVQNPVLGIGNTFQGAANCILFTIFTQVIRSRLFSSLCVCCRHSNPRVYNKISTDTAEPVEPERSGELLPSVTLNSD